ncbi:hypothetical protein TELCIR_20047, partial [Teladorsagia circumcincta]
ANDLPALAHNDTPNTLRKEAFTLLHCSHKRQHGVLVCVQISMVKADGFFGYEMQSLDEDHVDPLGPVKVKKS